MAKSSEDVKDRVEELVKYTLDRNYDEVKRLVTLEKVPLDIYDAEGHKPLHHAAYRGDYKLCKLFLDCGADVNSATTHSCYTPLMFAGLNGNADVVSLLLEHGASITAVTSINRTAAQMAAFIGNHHVVSIINNFIPIEKIEYFTKNHGLEKEPKLPPHLCGPVHKMVIMTNINPVRIAMYVQDNPSLLENSKKVVRILNILSEKMYKDECNELLSLKYHHLAFVLNACEKFLNEIRLKCGDTFEKPGKEVFNPLIKHWIGMDEKGFPIALEKFLRQDVREYPYLECSLFQQLVRTLATGNIGEEPSAISILYEAVTGQQGFYNSSTCITCSHPHAEKKCSACKSVQYCDKTCQKLHWFTHKHFCADLRKVYEEEKKKEELNSETLEDKKAIVSSEKEVASSDQTKEV